MSSRKCQTGETLLLDIIVHFFIVQRTKFYYNIIKLYTKHCTFVQRKIAHFFDWQKEFIEAKWRNNIYSHRDCFSGIIDMVLADNRMVFTINIKYSEFHK